MMLCMPAGEFVSSCDGKLTAVPFVAVPSNRVALFQRLAFDDDLAGNHFACDDFHAHNLP